MEEYSDYKGRFRYTIIKSKRRTYSIKVTEDNLVYVRVPLRTSQAEVEKLLSEKADWIEKVISFNNANSLALPCVKSYDKAYVCGKLVPVVLGGRNFIDECGVHVASIKSFKTAYVNSLGGWFLSEFSATEAFTGLKSRSVGFRSMKSMWGRCSAGGEIIFNFKLLMLPKELQRYVMVHELCHTVHHDHSAAFWRAVSAFVPDWKKLRSRLKEYAFLARMY